MAEKLSNTSRSRLKAALDTWPHWQAGLTQRPTVTRRLNGFSNESFLVSNDNLKLVLRLNGESVRFGVDRDLEQYILERLRRRTFTPDLLYRDERLDFMVTRYIEGAQPDIDTDLIGIGRLFSSIHACSIDIETTLNPVDQAGYYWGQLAEPPVSALTACYEEVLARTSGIKPVYRLCHHDLLCENILRTGEELVALDWEYARLGDPAFDLAVFIETYELAGTAREQLLEAYGRPGFDVARIGDYGMLYRLIEILWWMLRKPDESSIDDKLAHLEKRLF